MWFWYLIRMPPGCILHQDAFGVGEDPEFAGATTLSSLGVPKGIQYCVRVYLCVLSMRPNFG